MTCTKLLMTFNVQVHPLNCKTNLNNPVSQTCRFSCEDGYTLEGDEYSVCLPNGVWSGRQATCVRYCSPMQSVKNGHITPSFCTNENLVEGVPSHTHCIHHCDENYRLFGVFERICQEDGTWTYENPVCKRQCPLLSKPMFGTISPHQCTAENPVEDDICTFSCFDGYALEGDTTTTCDNAGR